MNSNQVRFKKNRLFFLSTVENGRPYLVYIRDPFQRASQKRAYRDIAVYFTPIQFMLDPAATHDTDWYTRIEETMTHFTSVNVVFSDSTHLMSSVGLPYGVHNNNAPQQNP